MQYHFYIFLDHIIILVYWLKIENISEQNLSTV